MTPRSLLFSLCIFGIIVGLPGVYATSQWIKYRNLHVVDPGVLYRSGKLNPQGFERVIRELKIRCVVTFRLYKDGDPNPDVWEEDYCKKHGIRYEKIVPKKWHAPEDGDPIPADDSVKKFLQLMDKRKEIGPILVHCLAGKHRTGAFVAIYRMEYQGWTNAEAVEEMRDFGYDHIDTEDDVRGYIERYPKHRGQLMEMR